MTALNEIYNSRILELAANIPALQRLASPDATATAHSKLCGSTITVDIKLDGERVVEFGQVVKACLLGQASASIVARNVVGATVAEVREVAAIMRAMLKENGPPPGGRWKDLAILEPVRDYKARHASTMLVFEAIERAFDQIAERNASVEPAATA
ncbi:MAG: iron-sulfur cluster assembly scaffold protein [Hyphomicrobiaceae bacterium]